VLCSGLGLRLWLASSYYGNFDEASFELTAEIMRRGGNVYVETFRYNYTPIWSYILLALSYGSDWLGLPFHVVSRSFLTGVDLINALLIGRIAAQTFAANPRIGAARYWLNPVAILLVGFHGQFENLAALPLLLAVWLSTRSGDRPRTVWLWLLGTLALLIKHNTIFGVWMLFAYIDNRWRRASLMFVLSMCVFLLSFVPYLPVGLTGIVNNVLLYRGATSYGFGQLLPPILSMPLFAGGMLLLPVLTKRLLKIALPQAIGVSFVGLLTLTFGIGNQYYILPVIFGSISGGLGYWIYSLATTLLLLNSPHNLALLSLPPLHNVVWLITAGWFVSYFIPRARDIVQHRKRLPSSS
jgi:hypothetical protein